MIWWFSDDILNKSFTFLSISNDYCRDEIYEKDDGTYLSVIDRKLVQSVWLPLCRSAINLHLREVSFIVSPWDYYEIKLKMFRRFHETSRAWIIARIPSELYQQRLLRELDVWLYVFTVYMPWMYERFFFVVQRSAILVTHSRINIRMGKNMRYIGNNVDIIIAAERLPQQIATFNNGQK